ncbi:hypothetical protein IPA_09260 [Ignicoccus pacificus DSM 13166]|uniref:Uncharacterized protein n=1 Tax=Ignicoccus pacificus DSM 13166 TaxID=940294 RepID=A0A977PKI2_9CREN|nr:hypothetical protein IPA_09260 [Ignicoccus pacificus DSM 13166]
MERVKRLIVGNALSSDCFEGKVLDPVGAPPYPLRTVEVGGREVPAIPMVVEDCPEGAECLDLERLVVLKDGDEIEKACRSLRCQRPWPLRWLSFKRPKLVLKIKRKRRNPIINASIKKIDFDENKVILRGGRTIEYEDLVWTAPYDYLRRLLGMEGPKALEATVIIAKAKAEFDMAFHFGKANPALAIVNSKDLGLLWILAPGTHDSLSTIKHLVRKGYIEGIESFVSHVVKYYALEEIEIKNVNFKLKGRTAEWKEMGLNEVISCA